MVSSSSKHIRPPAVAGRFYPDSPRQCLAEVRQYTHASAQHLPGNFRGRGGIVPHAGWVCSGPIAGLVWRTLADPYHQPDQFRGLTIFLTGSVHTIDIDFPALDTFDAWTTPLGPLAVDHALRDAIAQLDDFAPLDDAHTHDHALEVQLPFIHHCFGADTRIVPCMIPPHNHAADWGRALGQLLATWPQPVLLVASSDLTHYGPDFRFTPAGIGPTAHHWAHHVNDQRLLDLITAMRADDIVDETQSHLNACGGGAIAAVLAAAQSLGSSHAHLLAHTDSATVLARLGHHDPHNSVGYAAVAF